MYDAMTLKPAVLIIEDEATQRQLLRKQLEMQGFQVVAAANGREGLTLWADHPEIRMVITDLSMPEGDGVEVVQTIRARETRYTYLRC